MFTGIVQRLGEVRSVRPVPFGAVLLVDTGGWSHRPASGESIAVSGCCLTVTERGDDQPEGTLRFDVVRQTLSLTTLGDLEAGDSVNLEHAVTPSALMGGHVVQGHVDGVGAVTGLVRGDEEWRVRVTPPAGLMDAIIEQGSVAVDGVSLTVAGRDASSFEVALIPTTIEVTTLGRVADGSRVNIETDYIARTVLDWLDRQRPAFEARLLASLAKPS